MRSGPRRGRGLVFRLRFLPGILSGVSFGFGGGRGVEAGLPLEVGAVEGPDFPAPIQDEEEARDAVEEGAVVRDGDDAALEAFEEVFQRLDRIDVEIVGGLVEKEDVGRLGEHAHELEAAPFAARKAPYGHGLEVAVEAEPLEEEDGVLGSAVRHADTLGMVAYIVDHRDRRIGVVGGLLEAGNADRVAALNGAG